MSLRVLHLYTYRSSSSSLRRYFVFTSVNCEIIRLLEKKQVGNAELRRRESGTADNTNACLAVFSSLPLLPVQTQGEKSFFTTVFWFRFFHVRAFLLKVNPALGNLYVFSTVYAIVISRHDSLVWHVDTKK